MNLKLPSIHASESLAKVARYQHLIVGVLLIGLFGYTAYVVQQALGVVAQPVESDIRMTFDAKTIATLRNLTVVPSQAPLGTLGKPDPFGL